MGFFGMLPPWLQSMQSGMGQGMTPGAGMPPQSNAPMNMQIPQMPTPQVAQSQAPPIQGKDQQPIGPAQMGMLSQMLASQTGKPTANDAMAQAAGAATGGMFPAEVMGGQTPSPGLLDWLFRRR